MSNHQLIRMIALFAVCMVRGAWGQDVGALRRRADSIAALWRDARLIVTIQDSLRRTTLPATMERAEAGALVVIADPSRLPLRDATADAWRILDDFYGTAARFASDRPVVLRVSKALPLPPNDGVGLRILDDMKRPDLALAIARAATVPRGDRALIDWLGMTPLPGVESAPARRVVYVELVTAPVLVARTCFEGDLAACRDALELNAREGAVRRWWTPAMRRRLVTENYAAWLQRNRPAMRALATACVQGGADSACTRILEDADPRTLPRPLSPSARALLIDIIREQGGRDAYERLVADSATAIPERLAAIAGVPLDSLVAEWRGAVMAARPRSVTVPWWTAFAAFVWLGVFATCALRSSRWRLG